MTRFLYDLAFHLLLPLLFLRLWWRSLQAPSYLQRWRERLGFLDGDLPNHHWSQRFGFVRPAQQAHSYPVWIWVHAVSVGESNAAAPLIRKLREERPEWGIVVTSMTPTGSDRIRALFGDQVCQVYAPYDYSGAVKRFLGIFRPALVILVETELWPNLIHYSKASGAAVVVVNARLSEKSCKGYERVGLLSKPMLGSIDCIGAQAASDAARFRRLGVAAERLTVTGNLKFEMQLPADHAERRTALAAQIEGKRPVWIAASTREGEDAKVLRAFTLCLQSVPDLLLILVPRHPERFAAAALLCEEQGLQVVTRSSGAPVSPATQVLLGDSMGEMLAFYSISDVAFVGGSLVDTGCQNVLEPAALGLPVLAGPSRYNFAEACEILEAAGNLRSVADELALAAAVVALLGDPERRAAMGTAGLHCMQANRGALQKTWLMLDGLVDPRPRATP